MRSGFCLPMESAVRLRRTGGGSVPLEPSRAVLDGESLGLVGSRWDAATGRESSAWGRRRRRQLAANGEGEGGAEREKGESRKSDGRRPIARELGLRALALIFA
jgi:hypothetical protein